MDNSYQRLLAHIDVIDTPHDLQASILRCIEDASRKKAARWLVVDSVMAFVSLASFVVSAYYLLNDFYRTGFYTYLSLFFSDGSFVLSAWKDFLLTLIESVPLTSVTVFLLILFILLLSIKFITKEFNKITVHVSV
jgi:hypothetical protein